MHQRVPQIQSGLWMLASLPNDSCDRTGKYNVWLELNQFLGKRGQSILIATGRTIYNIKVFTFYITEFSQRLQKYGRLRIRVRLCMG